MKNIQVPLVEVPKVEDIYIMLNQLRKGFLHKSKNLNVPDSLACANCGVIISIIPDNDIKCTKCNYTNKIGRLYVTATEPDHGVSDEGLHATTANGSSGGAEPESIPVQEASTKGKRRVVKRIKGNALLPRAGMDEAADQRVDLPLLPGSVVRDSKNSVNAASA